MLPHDLREHFACVEPHRRGNPGQFQHINPALAGFVGADERLRLAQLGREVLLPEAGLCPKFSEDSANNPMLFWTDPHDPLSRP